MGQARQGRTEASERKVGEGIELRQEGGLGVAGLTKSFVKEVLETQPELKWESTGVTHD